ncbi:MAG: DoxX family protein [Pseudomonadota bacterium]
MIDNRTAPYAALILRVSLGVMLIAHGLLLKVFAFTVPGTVGYFESLGYPAILAYAVIAAEIVGGAALIVGAFVRPVSLLLVPVLIGATMVHAGNGWVFSAEGGGWEFPAFWTVTLVVQALLGAGAYAFKPTFAARLHPALA